MESLVAVGSILIVLSPSSSHSGVRHAILWPVSLQQVGFSAGDEARRLTR